MEARSLNILLVDDDEVDVMSVKRAFRKANITNHLQVAGNGIEALHMLRSGVVPNSRRLVLLDLNMPKMNGLEFLRTVRESPDLRALSVVVLTTSNEERDKVAAYDLNVAGYLLKPVTTAEFMTLMLALNNLWTLVEMT